MTEYERQQIEFINLVWRDRIPASVTRAVTARIFELIEEIEEPHSEWELVEELEELEWWLDWNGLRQ